MPMHRPGSNTLIKGVTNIIMKKGGKSNTNMWLLVGAVVLIIGVIYMLASNRSSHKDGFEGEVISAEEPLEWDENNEVMVVFHKMKGCPHCDDFQAVWDEVYKTAPAQVMEQKKKTCRMVTLAPHHPIEKSSNPVNGFPTTRIYKSKNKFVEFEDARTPENLSAFILKNA